MKPIYLISLLAFPAVIARLAYPASSVATCTQTVTSTISIRTVSGLDFGSASAGAEALAVQAGNEESSGNASFVVSGEPYRTYSITLPADGTVFLKPTEKDTEAAIGVNDFRSSPAATGTIGSEGNQPLFVGATRDPLRKDLAPGVYSGSFTVTVVY